MCLPHEYGIAHSNEMGTELWRIQQVRRIEGTIVNAVLHVNMSPSYALAPMDLRTQLDAKEDPAAVAAERQAAVDRIVAEFGDDLAAATEVLVMLDLVA